jgi:hypothetical protein
MDMHGYAKRGRRLRRRQAPDANRTRQDVIGDTVADHAGHGGEAVAEEGRPLVGPARAAPSPSRRHRPLSRRRGGRCRRRTRSGQRGRTRCGPRGRAWRRTSSGHCIRCARDSRPWSEFPATTTCGRSVRIRSSCAAEHGGNYDRGQQEPLTGQPSSVEQGQRRSVHESARNQQAHGKRARRCVDDDVRRLETQPAPG